MTGVQTCALPISGKEEKVPPDYTIVAGINSPPERYTPGHNTPPQANITDNRGDIGLDTKWTGVKLHTNLSVTPRQTC